MNILTDDPVTAFCENRVVTIRFKSGQELTFPIDGNPRLETASEQELNTIELSPFGIHWPKLDEDLSFEGILRGDFGQTR